MEGGPGLDVGSLIDIKCKVEDRMEMERILLVFLLPCFQMQNVMAPTSA